MSVHGENPLHIQAPRKGLVVGAAFQRRVDQVTEGHIGPWEDVDFTLFGTGHL